MITSVKKEEPQQQQAPVMDEKVQAILHNMAFPVCVPKNLDGSVATGLSKFELASIHFMAELVNSDESLTVERAADLSCEMAVELLNAHRRCATRFTEKLKTEQEEAKQEAQEQKETPLEKPKRRGRGRWGARKNGSALHV